MKEQLISKKTAKLAKERGFGIECEYYGIRDGDPINDTLCRIYKEEDYFYEYPAQSLLQKWLRETQDIFVTIRLYRKAVRKDFKYGYCIQNNNNGEYYKVDGHYIKTYEVALEKGLQEALKLIQPKDNG